MGKKSDRQVIARFTCGEIEAVVHLQENPFDRYRYPVFDLKRVCHSREGKRLANQSHFFDYNQSDLNEATKQAWKFITKYKQNPEAALKDMQRREAQATPESLAA